MPLLPARRADVLISFASGEAIVYDDRTGQSLLLDTTATHVLELCGTETTEAQAGALLDLDQAQVGSALRLLAELDLLVVEEPSRRRILQSASVIGGGLLLTTMRIPSAAAAASVATTGSTLASNSAPSRTDYHGSFNGGGGPLFGQAVSLPPGARITGYSFDASMTSGVVHVPFSYEIFAGSVPGDTQDAAARIVATPASSTSYDIDGFSYTVPSDGKVVVGLRPVTPQDFPLTSFDPATGAVYEYMPEHPVTDFGFSFLYSIRGIPAGSASRRALLLRSGPVVLSSATVPDGAVRSSKPIGSSQRP